MIVVEASKQLDNHIGNHDNILCKKHAQVEEYRSFAFLETGVVYGDLSKILDCQN